MRTELEVFRRADVDPEWLAEWLVFNASPGMLDRISEEWIRARAGWDAGEGF
jgi:hypothetical protein